MNGGAGAIPVAVHTTSAPVLDSQQMEEMYQKYNPEYLAATNKPMEVPMDSQEGA